MTLCKFYRQGNCSCRFEHPGSNETRGHSQNRFGALSAGSSRVDSAFENALTKYSISTDAIRRDLTTEAPEWILSSYGPGRNAPGLLFEGFPREQSFEEMRLHYYAAKAVGNEQQALNEAQELYRNAKQQMDNAVNDLDGAARFVIEAEHKHPNKYDYCREMSKGAPFGVFSSGRRNGQPAPQANPFSTAPSTSASTFGQNAAPGQRPNPFGTPTFGQPSQANAAFGQPSQPSPFGQTSQSSGGLAFGQTGPATSAFGQPSALGSKPNPFGTPAFGQAAQPAASQGSAFGQASQMGGVVKPNPFASAAADATAPLPSAFAPASNQGPAPALNPFANSNANLGSANASSPFASTSALQNNASQPNPFGQQPQTQNPSPFGQQPQTQNPSPFGQATRPNPFASANGPGSKPPAIPFGQPTQNQTNGFASGGQQQQKVATAAPATTNGAGNPYPPGSSRQHPPIDSYATKKMDGTLASFKGKPVTYKDRLPGVTDFSGSWTRIWFPDGPPNYYKDTELPAEQYDEKSKSQWAAFVRNGGTFADGLMPELPPPRECTQWDF
ncbi:CCCH zinc finger domain protein [Moelleriella libera RCEF 2490]|uniref:CCCH zinc finger domain protein n=1 Tax=Moelleriella libera RCEF 2490 TaxID=1081109 RepID=A0A162IF35_9HYPO|nr:CCCH zinc finger domain protein [Moelleriella libera RCEF 2490]